MEMRDIRYALAALDTGSFARAAEALFVSRQALSQAVHRLEGEIGVPLFEVADGNRLVCTPEGAIFLAQARPVAEAFAELVRAYPSARDARASTLALSLATGVALSLPDGFFTRFSERESQLVLEFEEGNTDSAIDLLESGRAGGVGEGPGARVYARRRARRQAPGAQEKPTPPACATRRGRGRPGRARRPR